MPGELVELGERARVQQQLDPLAGGLLALGVLLLDRGREPACTASSIRASRSASLPAVVWMSGAELSRSIPRTLVISVV